MKKLLFLFLFLTSSVYGADEVREYTARDWKTSAVTVSSTTVTAIPTTPLSGRYRIIIENTNSTQDLSISTSSVMTYAAGFIVTDTAEDNPSVITLPLKEGTTVYGLSQAGATASVDVRIIELK